MSVQTTLFNDTAYENHQSIYIKWQQVKVEWGVSGREGEREREEQIKGVREGACRREPNMAWVGNDHWKGHLRIWGLAG